MGNPIDCPWPPEVHFVSKSKALEHVLANGGLQEEVNHSTLFTFIPILPKAGGELIYLPLFEAACISSGQFFRTLQLQICIFLNDLKSP